MKPILKFLSSLEIWKGVIGVVALIFVFIGLVAVVGFFIAGWFGSQVTPPNLPSERGGISSSPSSEGESVGVFNGSFTELFSGTGWSDGSQTTAYLDQTTTAISLVPEFTVTETSSVSPEMKGEIAKIPANITGTVVKTNEGYLVNALGYKFTSPYQGVLRFGYDPQTGTTLVVYAAYMSRVFQVDARGKVIDYSAHFGNSGRFDARAFGGMRNGELAVYPVIFSKDGAWWITSGEGSTKPFLEKISGSSVIDYASLAFSGENTLRAAPGTASHTIVVTGGAKTYLLRDDGFSQKSVQWASSRLNDWNGAISRAVITGVDASDAYKTAGGVDEGTIRYFLSNDGGSTWTPASVGVPVNFPSTGGDFRFKIELSPSANNKYVTPWAGTIAVEYQIARK